MNKFICVDCNITFTDQKKYKKHLSSIKHLNQITNIPINKLEKEVNENLKLDPFLNNEDINKLENDSLGDGITIQFNNNHTVNLKYEKENIQQQEPVKETIEEPVKEPIKEKIIITQKQIQIIKFLIKFQNHKEMITKFYKILQTINLKDLNKLDTHIISTNHINITNKQKIIKIFNAFKKNLIKLKEKGETTYNNIIIDDIINLITL
tara:strand:- start:151 stop:774 length:624 start_codon:yes stop_codon:yes gene_type:complete